MEIKWTNPFSKMEETIHVSDEILLPNGFLRVPASFYEEKIWMQSLNGLIDRYHQGISNDRAYLAYMLLNVLEAPLSLVDRQVSRYIMNKESSYLGNGVPSTGLKHLLEYTGNFHFSNYEDLWNEIESLIFGDMRVKIINIEKSRIEHLFDGIIKAYTETHILGITKDKQLRRFRERYKTLIKNLKITNLELRFIRLQSYLYSCEFYHDIAIAFLSATGHLYDKTGLEVFRLLHFKILNPGYKNALEHLPPIASLSSFNAIRDLYKMVTKRTLLADTYLFVKIFDIDNIVENKRRNIFLSNVLSIIKWYRTAYMEQAHLDDKRNNINGTYFETSYSQEWNSDSENAYLELMDIRLGFKKIDSHSLNDQDTSKSWPHWEKRIEALGLTPETIRPIAKKRCTKKQQKALFMLLDERKSPEELSSRYGTTRRNFQGLLSDAFKRIETHP